LNLLKDISNNSPTGTPISGRANPVDKQNTEEVEGLLKKIEAQLKSKNIGQGRAVPQNTQNDEPDYEYDQFTDEDKENLIDYTPFNVI
jgi:hypothetical protein